MSHSAAPDPADPDAGLLAAYAAGERGAAAALTERLGPRAFAQAYRMLGEVAEAEDVAQEALLRLWRAAPGWRHGEAKVSTWLYRVVANLATDRLRRRGRSKPLEAAPEPEDETISVAAQLQQEDRASALREALSGLPPRQAEAVSLRHLEELGNPEIAEIMDIGVEAVESLVARGKRALKAALQPRRSALGWQDD
ncbi:sigma-70 family RNA polymerase sigma factor [Pseudoroseicyclus tamaricis]|uniref:Sigma-70 family RNA polymerase sigma factor n=1 Tax=Pseudoroseicyclus tamaricis TaxID=2705421 RepID=A0A6B2K1Y4_9RHOB|nr:sigma-70 family RNA polymerase sigma factor [Pseudoroseicyclus tamaricis]NDV00416.1 sigma-70 family RNA polymerase sigma factor [Pseudoroseicyclus tamaricis]